MTAHLQAQSSLGSHQLATQIEGWLLHSDIQIGDGAERGGIAGWLASDGTAEFVYPEIAGYYLTTMAWLTSGAASSSEHAAIARVRARRTARWLTDVLSNFAAPPTRLYLSEAHADWRNDAVFSFDIAMAARGISSTGDLPHRKTLSRLCGWLDRVSSGASILRSHETLGEATIPDRWSTRPGPHHLKAAAAVLRIDQAVAGNPLFAKADRTYSHWASTLLAGQWPCNELHALFYGLEGLLIGEDGNGDRLDQAAFLFARLMEVQASDGTLPETLDGGIVRSDVLAQGLRIGLLLRGHGYLAGSAWTDRLDALAHALMGFVRIDGGVLFAMDQSIANAWCAMFAHQALYLHARRHGRDPAPEAAFRYLV
jgi:hypothetical protein